ncbi:MAG: glycosyltransferase [Eubacteriales bacterium]|nr:glycosyltransferase [Eubacteriales bacterium]
MNILLSAYSINPYKGSEDAVGWNWALTLSRKLPDSTIYILTRTYNEIATKKGIKEYGLQNVKLVIVEVPKALDWFREKHSAFHHAYYILWQKVAYNWAKKSGIKFDIIHHVTMGDFRIPGYMQNFKDTHTIFGPVGGGQCTPKALKCYEKSKSAEKVREIINNNISRFTVYKKAIRKFDDVYAINNETEKLISKALVKKCKMCEELAVAKNFSNLDIKERNNGEIQVLFVGRLIEKKGLMLLIDIFKKIDKSENLHLSIYGSGPLENKIKEEIKNNNLEKMITVMGKVEYTKIINAYKNADIFIMPSLRETSGNVLIEALASKIPVIALDMSFASKLNKLDCGKFINPNQSKEKIIDDFAKATVELANNKKERERLAQNGYNFVNEELTWDNKFDTVYGSLIK